MILNNNDILCESLMPEIYEDDYERKLFRVICYNASKQSFEYLTGPYFDSLDCAGDCRVYYDKGVDQYYATVQDELRYCVKHEKIEDLYKNEYKVCPDFCIDVRVGLYLKGLTGSLVLPDIKFNFEPIKLQRFGYEDCVYKVEKRTVYADDVMYRGAGCELLINDSLFNVNIITSCDVHLNNDNPRLAVMTIRCGKMTPSAIAMLRKVE